VGKELRPISGRSAAASPGQETELAPSSLARAAAVVHRRHSRCQVAPPTAAYRHTGLHAKATCQFQPSARQERVGYWQLGCSWFCCRGRSWLSYISTNLTMRVLPQEVECRREFFRAAARYGLLALISTATCLAARPREPGGQRCVNQGICSNCGVFVECGLPQALSAKQAKERA
jgi:hypothetical protein